MSTFRLPSVRLRRSLAKAQTSYQKDLSLAAGFLADRKIPEEWANKYGLGVAASPTASHERFRNRLAIPYWNAADEVIAMVFRCTQDHTCTEHGHRKYDQPDNQTQFLYNLPALDGPKRVVHVSEGELDAIVLSEVLDQPVVGVSGADKWQAHWPAHFYGFDRVVAWPDGDKAGKAMASTWTRKVGAEIVTVPWESDVGDVFKERGAEGLIELYRGGDDVGSDD